MRGPPSIPNIRSSMSLSSTFLAVVVLCSSRAAWCAPDPVDSSPRPYDAAARTERQQIISELDGKLAAAKREQKISVDVVPALRACAPLDAPVESCRAAADRVAAELDKKLSLATAKAKESESSPNPPRELNITVINNNDHYWHDIPVNRPSPRAESDAGVTMDSKHESSQPIRLPPHPAPHGMPRSNQRSAPGPITR